MNATLQIVTAGRLALMAVLLWADFASAQALGPPTTRPCDTATVDQIEFRDVVLADALRLLSRQTGMNLVASAEAGRTKVSLYLQNVSARSAVEELCRANNLWFRQDQASGVVRIMLVSEFQRDLTAFREDRTQVFAVLYPNAVSIAGAIADLYGDRVRLSLGGEEDDADSQDLNQRFSRFDLIDQRSQGTGVFGSGGTTLLGGNGYGGGLPPLPAAAQPTANGSNGGAQSGDDLRKLTPAQAEAAAKAMADGATPQQQALLDALGRKPASIYVRVLRRTNLIVVRSADPTAMEDITRLIRRLDVPTPMILLEVKVLQIALEDDFTSVFDYQFSDGSTVAGGFSTGEILPPAGDLLSGRDRRFASMTPGGSGVRNKDLIFQVVSNSFRARMQLLDDKNRVTEMATPMLLTSNNEVSRLFVGEERPIVRNISSQVVLNTNNTAVAPNTSIEFRPVGTTLLLTPSINADRTVTLRMLQENSRIVPDGATIPVVTANGGIISQPVDVVASRTLSGTVVAKDGLAIAVGGLIEERLQDRRGEVPILGKVPGLGFFFRRQQTERTRTELIIMIRPHVLSTPAESEAISQDLAAQLSLHPKANDPTGTLGTFAPGEVLRPNLPKSQADAIFRFHSVAPADY